MSSSVARARGQTAPTAPMDTDPGLNRFLIRVLMDVLTFWPLCACSPFECDVDLLDPGWFGEGEGEDASEESGRDIVPLGSTPSTRVLALREDRAERSKVREKGVMSVVVYVVGEGDGACW